MAGSQTERVREQMKKKCLVAAVSIMIFALCTACGLENNQASAENETVSTVSEAITKEKKPVTLKEMDKEIQTNSSIQPGAGVSTGVNEDGQMQYEFKNPDGSGGGGVVMD